jgi:hypothetical protein
MPEPSEFRVWPARYKSWRLDVHESNDHYHWFSTVEVRSVLAAFRADKLLQNAYGHGVKKLDKGSRLFISENALVRELRRMGGREALMFLGWLEANIIYPSQRKRGEVPGIQAILSTSAVSDGSGVTSDDLPIRVPRAPEVTKARAAHHRPPAPVQARNPGSGAWRLILRHWRGQESLARSFFVSGLATLVFTFTVVYAISAATDASTYTGSYVFRQWLVLALLLLLGVGWAWWTIGLMRSSIRRYQQGGRFWSNLTAYVGAFALLLNSGTFVLNQSSEWIEGWWETVTFQLTPTQIVHDPVLGRLVISGEIGFGSYQALEQALRQKPRLTLVELNSPGGYVFEGLAMAELIRKNGFDTVSFEDCESACTLIFAAGGERYLGPQARVGFHRSWSLRRPLSTSWSRVDHVMADYYQARGTSFDFVKAALDTPSNTMWYPQHGLMLEAGYATRKWYDRGTRY